MALFPIKSYSLRSKATLIVVVVVVASLSLTTIINIYQTNRLIESEQKRSAESIVRGLSQAAELPMIVQDMQELDRLLEGFLWNSQVQFLLVYNNENEIVARRILDESAFAHFNYSGSSGGSLVVSNPIMFRTDENFQQWSGAAPGKAFLGDKEVGKVVVALSLGAVRQAQLYQAFVSLVAAHLAAAFGIFLIFNLIGKWSRRVDGLVAAADAMKSGDFCHRVPADSRDEIGKLASAFEAMRKAVRQRDSELRELNGSLHDLVKERTEKLERAMLEAQTANEAKSSFLANMSHEIRTPMNAIIGMVGLALNKKLNPKLREYLLTVRSSAESLLAIINDLLDFSKIEAGKITLEKVDFQLYQFFNKLADLFGDQAANRDIELIIGIEPGIPVALRGDSLRLEQVFVNLLGNAIKFTEHGEIFVNATIDSELDDTVRILFSVKDTGVGIRKDQYESLFEPFTQADGSTTREYGGTGLGLSICRRLVNLHGGEIWVDSTPGEGTTVFFTAEFVRLPQEREIQYVVPATIRGLKVLVIDDNETARCITTKMLESFHFQVDVASSCTEGRRLIGEDVSRYDLLLVDWRMPGIDGIECVQGFREMNGAEKVPIIMMTAFGGDREIVLAKEAGIKYFLTKPVKQSLLFDTIMDIFNYPEAMHVSLDERENSRLFPGSVQLAGVRILLAEDNHINQIVARELLESVGVIVEIANNGQEAVHILQDRGEEFDGVLMDVQMPVMDGYEATKVIRSNPVLSGLPVIAVTAHAMQSDRDKCIQAGMNDYVAKPITPELLFSVITRWMRPDQLEPMYREDQTVFALQKSMADLPESFPGVHVESGVARMAGNMKSYLRMLKDLQEFGNEVAERLPRLLEEDLEAAAREVHTLKGTAANLSAHHLQDVSLQLELDVKEMLGQQHGGEGYTQTLHAGRLEIIEDALTQLGQVVGKLEDFCGDTKERPVVRSLTTGDREAMLAILVQLEKMIGGFDPMAEEYWLEQKEMFYGQGVDEEMARLENHLRNYNFERGTDFLSKIKSRLFEGGKTG
ncbi:MAG: response regulator [Proteobacteria bacterium]|nr:response regulator [Pseudomonadota bacterium]MBU1060333.1 response regulator [Pseudomonadota bacterium]